MKILAKYDWPALRRRAVSSVTLLAYLACAIGFPMPDASARGASACGQSVCCCGTAAQCQASGCGCTPAPKPKPAVKSCCAKKNLAETKSCSDNEATKADSDEARPAPIRWVIGVSAQKCRGGQTDWVSTDVALPGPPPADWQPSWPYCHSVRVFDAASPFLADAPRDPPPR